MSLGSTRAVALCGLEGTLVEVEAHVAAGLPQFTVTGLPDKVCGLTSDRVRSAGANSGLPLPPHRITVNLSPASIAKRGTGFDVAMAVAVLGAAGHFRPTVAREVTHIGELALGGAVKRVNGVLPAVLAAQRAGARHVVVPVDNVSEAQLVEGVVVHGVSCLAELVSWYAAAADPADLPLPDAAPAPNQARRSFGDLADVVGQPEARLALELAAVGNHHVLLMGPPGVGKTMLAERLVTILPPLTRELALQTHAVRSLIGEVAAGEGLDHTPPFVAPHHSATEAAIVGGGSAHILPGAISQAHGGVLFLDEAPEFKGGVLQVLRQPLESGEVVIARALETIRYPARFQLVMAANPCPCGRAWGKGSECTCTPMQIRTYSGRLSGPLLDRIDIRVLVPPVGRAVFTEEAGESSAVVAARVAGARAVQAERWGSHGWVTNSQVPGKLLRSAQWRPPRAAMAAIDRALDHGQLTLRGYDRILRLAWSCADLEGAVAPLADHLAQAYLMRTEAERAA